LEISRLIVSNVRTRTRVLKYFNRS
jgi:hypothetical protein